MTSLWKTNEAESVSLEELCEHFDSLGDTLFEHDLDRSAQVMGRLFNNRDFLAEHLSRILRGEIETSFGGYSSQVFVLRNFKYFTVRAVVWDRARGIPGEEIFLYEKPHDHDFSFFTLGYFGPGYRTSIYNYQHDAVVGLEDEEVKVDLVEEWELAERDVVLYRSSVDIHTQSPPASLSISVNILQNVPAFGNHRRQYEFSGDLRRIRRVVNLGPQSLLLKAGAQMGGPCIPFVEEIARSSRNDCIRFSAVESLVRSVDANFVEIGLADPSAYVRQQTARLVKRLA